MIMPFVDGVDGVSDIGSDINLYKKYSFQFQNSMIITNEIILKCFIRHIQFPGPNLRKICNVLVHTLKYFVLFFLLILNLHHCSLKVSE